LFSESSAAISFFNKVLSSSVFTYFSDDALFSILSMIFMVVATPTSELIKTFSSSSKTSSSTFDLPLKDLNLKKLKEIVWCETTIKALSLQKQ
jgi:hypothetical protein